MTEDGQGGPPAPGAVLAFAVLVYGAMAGAALLWLDLSGSPGALVDRAVGARGPVAASALGLGVGLLGAWAVGRLAASKEGFQAVRAAVQRLFVRATDGVIVAFALISAVGEELFFRLAVQEVFGLFGSVAAYVVLNSSVGGLRWRIFTFAHALALGLIVHAGFGLLGSTTAHAVLNYLSLRRLQDS